ncbi:MAG: hypothetical protein GX596_14775 [Propionibacterium sp.]|nr:hypothetical protein [Propionibacterium sp.]
MKMKWLIAPLAAAALAVAGCSGDGETTPEPEPTVEATDADAPEETAPAEPETDVEEPEAPEEAPTDEAPAESDGRVEAAIEAFLAAHEGAERIPASDLDLSAVPTELGEEIEVTPEECAALAEDSGITDIMGDAVSDGAMQMDMETFSTKVLMVMDFPSSGDAGSLIESILEQNEVCSEMTITMQGVSTSFRSDVEEIDIDGADEAFVQLSMSGEGETLSTSYNVFAQVDDLIVSGSSAGGAGMTTHVVAQEIVEDALAAIG